MLEITDLNRRLRDPAYTAVGFGVLGFQRAQVRRRELTHQIETVIGPLRAEVARRGTDLEERLPNQARSAARSLRAVAGTQEALLREVIGRD